MITAVVSRKGGVGKTTTSVNLAAALAEAGFRVLLVDLDANAGASLSLGVRAAAGSADLFLRLDDEPEALVRSSSQPGLDVIAASADLRTADVELHRLRRKEQVLRKALDGLTLHYDHIFLDCPGGFGIVTKNALVAADCYLVPAAPHFLALDGIEHLEQAVERLAGKHGQPIPRVGILLTMVDYRIRSTRTQLTVIRRRFGRDVFAVEVRTNVSLAEAPAEGLSIFGYAPRSTGAHAYRLVAQELLLRAPALAPPSVAVV